MTGHVPEEQISAWLDRELDARDAARVEEHLGACETCREWAREMTAVGTIFRAAGRLELSPFLWTRIASALERELPMTGKAARLRRLAPVLNRLRIPVAAAASLILAAGGFLLVRQGMESRHYKRMLSEIDSTRIAATASFHEESYNPFFRPVSADREVNPFSRNKLDPGLNPFRATTGTR